MSTKLSVNSIRVLSASAAAVLAVGWLGTGAASAHVSPDKSEVPAGGYTDVQLLVPHGCDGEATGKVEVQVPAQLVSASPYVIPGWTAAVEKAPLDEPITDSHGAEVTERDAVITWTAEPGNELPEHQRLNFGIGFQTPDAVGETMFFKTIQTCASGTSEWITEWDGTGDEPDTPAPAVKIVEGSGDGHGGDAPGDDQTDAGTDGEGSGSSDDDDSAATPIAVAGLVAGIAGLGLGGAAFAKTRKA